MALVAGLLLLLLTLVPLSWLVLPVYKVWVQTPRGIVRFCKQQGVPELKSSSSSTWLQQIARTEERRLFQSWDELLRLSSSFVPKNFLVSIGKTVRLFISDPSLLRGLLIGNADFYCKPSFVREIKILGNGVFSSYGEDWARQKPLLLPAFLVKETKIKVPAMVDCTEAAVEKLNVRNEEIQVDIYQLFLELSLDILDKTGFGGRVPAPPKKLISILDRYLHNIRQLLFGLDAVLPGYSLLRNRIQKQVVQDERWIANAMSEAIQARSSEREQQLIDVVLRAGDSNSMTGSEVLDNCVTFLLAGHETSARLLTWTFYLLALNPRWQQRARVEANEVLGENAVRWENLNELKILTLIIMESLRLYPPQPLLGRLCMQQNKLGEYMVPAGLEIIVPVAAVHRSQEFWGENAAEFRPERFVNGIKAACSHPMAYLPFGAGPRTCIGQTLATTQTKVVLSTLIRRFSWKLSDSYIHHPDLTLNLQPGFGMPVVLEALRDSD